MIRKTVLVFGLSVLVLLVAVFGVALNVPLVSGSETIYIKADGSIDPPTANITSADNVTYTFTGNINDSIVIERDNIVVDGAGYTLQGARTLTGIRLSGRSNVTIKNMEIKAFDYGITLIKSFNNTLIGNNLTEIFFDAIILNESFNNTIAGNSITGRRKDVSSGISMRAYPGENGSSYNTFYDNNVSNCGIAISIPYWSGGGLHHNNVFLRNNVIDNFQGVMLDHSFNFTFKGNTFSENIYNVVGVYGLDLPDYIHDIDTSNTVNGKPIYYLVNQQNLTISPPAFSNIGYLALINSTNTRVENISLQKNGQGLLMAYTRNSTIINNDITNNILGIYMDIFTSNNIISENNITDHPMSWGIKSKYSFNNSLIRNTVSNNKIGIYLENSFNNTLAFNTIANNSRGGVWLDYSFNNILVSNDIKNNSAEKVSDAGVSLYQSYMNRIFHNNFISNQRQAYTGPGNVWDDGYHSGGNYWSDYNGTDSDQDGIGDTPYTIDENNQDNYPLMGMFSNFTISWEEKPYHLTTICNSTISNFRFNASQRTISFNVTGPDYTLGFCRITIPNVLVQELWNGNYTVLVDGKEVLFKNWTDGTNIYLYFTYMHSEHEVTIVPEFPSATLLPLLTVLTMLSAVFAKRRFPRKIHS